MIEPSQLSVLPSVQMLLRVGVDLNDTNIAMEIKRLKDVHMNLGVLYANSDGRDYQDTILKPAMCLCADLYQIFTDMNEELKEYYKEHE